MKINKTIDVSDYPDNAIQNFERFAKLSAQEIDNLLAGVATVKKAEDQMAIAKRVIKKVLHVLENPYSHQYGSISNYDMAGGIRKVAKDEGIDL